MAYRKLACFDQPYLDRLRRRSCRFGLLDLPQEPGWSARLPYFAQRRPIYPSSKSPTVSGITLSSIDRTSLPISMRVRFEIQAAPRKFFGISIRRGPGVAVLTSINILT